MHQAKNLEPLESTSHGDITEQRTLSNDCYAFVRRRKGNKAFLHVPQKMKPSADLVKHIVVEIVEGSRRHVADDFRSNIRMKDVIW